MGIDITFTCLKIVGARRESESSSCQKRVLQARNSRGKTRELIDTTTNFNIEIMRHIS